jgi:iron complex outermembrane receptor protein
VQFTSRVLIAPGGPLLDLLGGDALSTSGTPRHSLEFNGGLFHRGKGLFLQGTWAAPTRLEASGLPGSSDLRFGALTKVNANFFVDLGDQGKLAERHPFLKGLRLALRFENLFDSRQQVTDGNRQVPLSYQQDYLDPRGRVIEFEVRKMF